MKKVIPLAIITLILTATAQAQPTSKADAIIGQWYTDENDSIVEITKDRQGKYNGKIIWLKEPIYPAGEGVDTGKPKRDRKNDDANLRHIPIIGLVCMKNFIYDALDAEWNKGTIYDPETGNNYKCVAKPKTPNSLDVRGYIGIPAFGRSTIWNRVPEDKLFKKDEEKGDA